MAYDWGDYNTQRPSSYSQESLGGPVEYGGLNINYAGANILYGGNSKPIMTTDVQGSGFSARATFVTVGQSEPFSIQGLFSNLAFQEGDNKWQVTQDNPHLILSMAQR